MFENKIEKLILIEGMHCSGCVARVENVLKTIKEVKMYTVNLENKQAKVILKKNIEDNILKEKIENLGFKVVEIKNI